MKSAWVLYFHDINFHGLRESSFSLHRFWAGGTYQNCEGICKLTPVSQVETTLERLTELAELMVLSLNQKKKLDEDMDNLSVGLMTLHTNHYQFCFREHKINDEIICGNVCVTMV